MIDDEKPVTPERVHEMFHALRFHLTSSYDFRKYNGKIKRLGNKPNGHHFYIAKNISHESDLMNFFLVNFAEDFRQNGRVSGFIGDIAAPKNIHFWKNKNEGEMYKYIAEDVREVFRKARDSGRPAKESFVDPKKFFSLYLNGEVTIYTMVAFIKTFGLLKRFGPDDDPLITEVAYFLERISLLIKINPIKFKKIIESVKENLKCH